MPIDPICKNRVPVTTRHISDYGGKKYHFCSAGCKSKFDELEKNVIRLKRNLGEKERISFGKLRKEIIKPGICTLCGACASTCESISIVDGKPKLVGPCTACGVCYNQCPRTITTEEGLIGRIRFAYSAKTAISDLKGQDGGVVTSMLAYALEEGLIDCAIVTVRSEEEPWKPVPIIARTYDELIQSTGSIYIHSMTMEALMSSIKQGMRSIAFVGPGCNIDAVYKMQKSPYGFLHMFMRANILKMGLFCMDTFSYGGIKEFVETKGLKLEDIESMKIRRGQFEFDTKGETKSFALNEFDAYRSSSCKFCTDLTAENADISFGGVGSPQGRTTVLARSGLGYEIFNEAVDSGYIKSKTLGENEMERVLNLAKMKKVQMYALNRRHVPTP
ncbi:MAG TPA: YHS domain-containing protein [Methanosarcinaceae archaeon]|nr:YHS domain-containing protein [Methanosarcinaceae archaeon]